MSTMTNWWIIAGVAVVVELFTGTFYLLMVALGLVAGGVAAWLGLPLTGQLIASALVGGGAVLAMYLKRRQQPGDPPASANRSINLDIDAVVQIDQWQPDGTSQIRYRGAQWTAVLRPGMPARAGAHRVAELAGSQLIVEPLAPTAAPEAAT
ncbi:MAG: NfeD family protein [Burkholderiaceae bacterium]|jgi:membrane protein implicated in regulation of membrane protease activity|nr:NfeD family protein [Burkholderiaceae bacterium]